MAWVVKIVYGPYWKIPLDHMRVKSAIGQYLNVRKNMVLQFSKSDVILRMHCSQDIAAQKILKSVCMMDENVLYFQHK